MGAGGCAALGASKNWNFIRSRGIYPPRPTHPPVSGRPFCPAQTDRAVGSDAKRLELLGRLESNRRRCTGSSEAARLAAGGWVVGSTHLSAAGALAPASANHPPLAHLRGCHPAAVGGGQETGVTVPLTEGRVPVSSCGAATFCAHPDERPLPRPCRASIPALSR